ncbi:hypothetical protein [Streptomyces luteireticuli]|uniref:hypothetical protein n=1 Tax=Streptomyces luteireticuli TaxID=173858 RepID=UPI00355795FE
MNDRLRRGPLRALVLVLAGLWALFTAGGAPATAAGSGSATGSVAVVAHSTGRLSVQVRAPHGRTVAEAPTRAHAAQAHVRQPHSPGLPEALPGPVTGPLAPRPVPGEVVGLRQGRAPPAAAHSPRLTRGPPSLRSN